MLRVRHETSEGTDMNDEKLRFVPGETTEVAPMEVAEVSEGGADVCLARLFVSELHVISDSIWLGRVTACGYTAEAAEALRDRLLWALQQPTVPAQWQVEELVHEPDYPGQAVWRNIDNGGEAARLKGKGFAVRALYQKQPLVE